MRSRESWRTSLAATASTARRASSCGDAPRRPEPVAATNTSSSEAPTAAPRRALLAASALAMRRRVRPHRAASARAAGCRAGRCFAPPARPRARGARRRNPRRRSDHGRVMSRAAAGSPSAAMRPAIEDREAVAALRLVHVMGGHEDRRAARDQREQALPKSRRICGSTALVGSSRAAARDRDARTEREPLALAAGDRAGSAAQRRSRS